MLRSLLILLLLAAAAMGDQPRVDDTEPVWSKWLAAELRAIPEASFRDEQGRGRVDVLTDKHAIEVEWALTTKGPEALDQASRYAAHFEREPVVVFLVGRGVTSSQRAIASTVWKFGREMDPPIRVLTLDVRDPDIEALRERLGIELDQAPAGQEAEE